MVFEKIQNDCVIEFMEDDSTDEYESFKLNPLYNPDLIDYFQKYYLPYIFIWGAYAFRNMDPDYSITKIDQGCIEKYFGTMKRIRGHLPIVPARHVLHSLRTVLANNAMLTTKSKKGKRKVNSK